MRMSAVSWGVTGTPTYFLRIAPESECRLKVDVCEIFSQEYTIKDSVPPLISG